MNRNEPEWPIGEKDVRWDFERVAATMYYFRYRSVGHALVKLDSLSFGRHAQHPRTISVSYMQPRARSRIWQQIYVWPNDGWLVIAKGQHPLERKEITSHGGMVSEGYEPMAAGNFQDWLVRQPLEYLVDFRAAAIAEGWRAEG